MKNLPIIERESEILALIDSYIAKGHDVKKPLLIRNNGVISDEYIRRYLKDKYGKSPLNCVGHPLRQGSEYYVIGNGIGRDKILKISDHPELAEFVDKFLPPAMFDPDDPPIFFHSIRRTKDKPWNPPYICECVDRYSIPFVYVAPPDDDIDLSAFDYVEYYPTINGWLMDMKSNEEFPNKKRVLETELRVTNYEQGYSFKKWRFWDFELVDLIKEQMKAQRFELLLDFADLINDEETFEDLVPDYYRESEPAVCFLLEDLMDYFTPLFFIRQVQPIVPELVAIEDKSKWQMFDYDHPTHNIADAFSYYLTKTEYNWVFNLEAPVPPAVIQETSRIIDEYKTKYGSVTYHLDALEAEKRKKLEEIRRHQRR